MHTKHDFEQFQNSKKYRHIAEYEKYKHIKTNNHTKKSENILKIPKRTRTYKNVKHSNATIQQIQNTENTYSTNTKKHEQ